MRFALYASLVSLAALAAACSGGGGGATSAIPSPTPTAVSSPTSTPGGACTDGNATLTLLSPPPGATAVSTNFDEIEVEANATLPGTIEIELQDKNGNSQVGAPITGSNPYFSTGFTLSVGETYSAYVINTAQSGCTATAIPGATFSS